MAPSNFVRCASSGGVRRTSERIVSSATAMPSSETMASWAAGESGVNSARVCAGSIAPATLLSHARHAYVRWRACRPCGGWRKQNAPRQCSALCAGHRIDTRQPAWRHPVKILAGHSIPFPIGSETVKSPSPHRAATGNHHCLFATHSASPVRFPTTSVRPSRWFFVSTPR